MSTSPDAQPYVAALRAVQDRLGRSASSGSAAARHLT
jgi:hypothetical protein